MTDVIQTPSTQPLPVSSSVLPSQPPVLKPTTPQGTPSYHRSRNLLIVLSIVVVILGIATLLIGNIHPKTKLSKLPPPDELLATVGDQKIYVSTVEAAAKEQYLPSAINKSVLKRFEDILIERAILSQEAKKLNITVADTEVTKQLTNQYANNQKVLQSPSVRSAIYYQLLKDKIIARSVKNISAYTVGFYIAPFNYPQKPEYARQRADGASALAEIEQKLTNNERPVDIAAEIIQKYPSLRDIFSINGHIFTVTTDKLLLESPVNVVLTGDLLDKNLMSPDLYNAFATIKADEVKKIEANDGSGGKVIKAIAVNSSGFLDYQSFLDLRKRQLVKIVNTL